MRIQNLIFIVLLCFVSNTIMGQTATLKGIIVDENNQAIPNVNISSGTIQTTSDKNGNYSLKITANQVVKVQFSHIAQKNITLNLDLKPNEVYEFNPKMNSKFEQMGEVVITSTSKRTLEGITTINPILIQKITGANAGIENVLKTLPGVNASNELSTQYAVRGGNFDENLVYVNEIEVYRPFLIRSGQQEGLSFTNTDLVKNVDFSAGGFQAKYGDKLSSVLDITYRVPERNAVGLEASFLGGSMYLDAISKNSKWSAVTGVRYRNNSLLVNSQNTQSNYNPTFVDLQTHINYNHNEKWNFSLLGAISQNTYNYQPISSQTKFGTIDDPKTLYVYYEGQEIDQYQTYFGASKITFNLNEKSNIKLINSLYRTTEKEYFDILAQYRLEETASIEGTDTSQEVAYTTGIASQLDHARNNLEAIISNSELKGFHNWKEGIISWGIKFTRESIKDRVIEWQAIDSADFFVTPQKKTIKALNYNTINRFSGYTQWSKKSKIGTSETWYNAGIRFHQWAVNGTNANGKSQTTLSPRAQFAIKPLWKKDILFRLSGGIYTQPPFYRELRDASGNVNPDVKAQQSVHLVASSDFSFKYKQRPLKLTTEVYYKSLTNVNTYTVDNVRIRYAADNNAIAYAQGVDLRLNGEFVPGTESWLSFGYLKTEENYANKGYIARPTDQRLKFAVLFQDYMKNIPSVKLYLNLVYNTGLPGGSPSYTDPYLYQSRLKDYRRVDAGFFKVLVDANNSTKKRIFKHFKELAIGFEIFNLFNNQNAITNTWVTDVDTKNQYAIPNYMTSRVFSVKLNMKL